MGPAAGFEGCLQLHHAREASTLGMCSSIVPQTEHSRAQAGLRAAHAASTSLTGETLTEIQIGLPSLAWVYAHTERETYKS